MRNLTNISEIENLNAIKGGCGGSGRRSYSGGSRHHGGTRGGNCGTWTPKTCQPCTPPDVIPLSIVTAPPAREVATGGKPA